MYTSVPFSNSRSTIFAVRPKATQSIYVTDLPRAVYTSSTSVNFANVISPCSFFEIERLGDDKTTITITTGKPGIIIGRGGSEIENLKKKLTAKFGRTFFINVKEVRNVDIEAQLVAESIAKQLEERVSFRRAMKQAISRAMKNGARGIKTMVSGRLGGAEIARFEQYREGSIPLHTLRADIDYGFAEAKTSYGQLGVKVWIYKGEVLTVKSVAQEQKEATPDVNA
jgi:small subunit ribosomal protein S3